MNKFGWGSKKLCAATVAALIFAAVSGGGAYAETATATAADQGAIPAVIAKTTTSVVAIIGKPSGGKSAQVGDRYNLAHGTGVVVKSDGYILTNAHVVKGMRNINVVTSDGRSYTGKTTHYDEESDLALVKIEATGLTPAVFAAPSDIKVGEPVMAIGTPLSFALRNSVTTGIVSGMDRSVQSKYQLIQTDAAINPGNSGGALVNMKGEVIGINTLKYVEYGVDGLGFAIPVDTVQHVLDHFFKYGKVKRPSLGLELGESWEAVVGLPSGSGLNVTYVEPDSPAAQAGVKQGDALLAIDSIQTHNLVEYNEALKKYLPGQTVRLSVLTDGKTRELDFVLGEESSGNADVAQDADGSYIDADQGKTRIGDSHFGWSMSYPAGLVKVSQSNGGNSVVLADAKGEFALNISVQEKQSEDLSPLGLLKKLSGDPGDAVLEKRYVDEPQQPYALLTGKRESGEYYQIRAYLKGEKIFYVGFYVEKEENFTNGFKRNSYEDLLDTFTLSFDSANPALKDISSYETGNSIVTEYGLAFDIPPGWSRRDWDEGLIFASEDGETTFSLEVTSAASGDTLKDWADREESKFAAAFVDGYSQLLGAKETTIDGIPALENNYAATMGDRWVQSRVIHLIKDKYKYELTFTYPQKADNSGTDLLISGIVNSARFMKEGINPALGFIQDENELADPQATVTYTNKKYRYSIRVPELWKAGGTGGEFEGPMRQFTFEGGGLTLSADDRSSLDETVNRLEQEHKKNAEIDANYKYTETEEELSGVPAKMFSTRYKSKNVPYLLVEYVLEKNGIVYTLRERINDAVKTDEQWQRLENALRSIQFD